MAGMIGMEIAAIRHLARTMDDRASAIETILRNATNRISSVEWAGNDRERFVRGWEDQHAPKLRAVAQGLRNAADKARFNASEQERISRGS